MRDVPRRLARAGAGLALLASPTLASSTVAHAESFDVTGFVERGTSGFTLDEPALDDGLADLAASLRPAFGASGATVGASGLALELGLGWSPIDGSSSTWQRALGDDAPDSLPTLRLSARKGLPSGFELEGAVAHQGTLELTAASFGVRWAWLEGTRGLPDLGVRLDGGAIVGDPQMTIITAGAEVVIGYPVPVAGLFRLAPYLGFSQRLAYTVERRVVHIPEASADPFVTVLPAQEIWLTHALIGLRVQSSALDVGLEATLGTTVGLVFQVGAKL